AAMPGRHRAIAKELTGGATFPVLVIDGAPIGDSTRIIEELEWRYPDPPLYPADAGDWRRALELEDFFDEELGLFVRLLFLHHVLPDSGLTLGAFAPDLKPLRRLTARLTFPWVRRRIAGGFGIDERSVAAAHDRLRTAGDRFRAELQPSGYLVGDGFTVADLTLASLV